MLDTIITNWLSVIVTAVVSVAATFMYRRQEMLKRDLENANQKIKNDSDTNSEWVRIVEERNAETARLMQMNKELVERIEQVYEEKRVLRDRLEKMYSEQNQAQYYKGLYESSRCDIYTCENRRPPLINIKKLVQQSIVSAEESNNNEERK